MNIFQKIGLFMFEWKVKREGRSSAYTQLELGDMYFQGRDGIVGYSANRYRDLQDFGKAFKWYLMAAENGVAEAQSMLGDMYRYNADAYDENELVDTTRHHRNQCLKKAFEWYAKAAKNGDVSAKRALESDPSLQNMSNG